MPLSTKVLSQLQEIVGSDNVTVDAQDQRYYSQDVYSEAEQHIIAGVRPGSTEELSAVVKIATGNDYSVYPRGAGVSYTGGFLPTTSNGITVDMTRMNRIVEINKEDMYVTVEAGCTWDKLYQALREEGLRTPFWGSLSGILATVGGVISQNGAFFGSGIYGAAADSVISICAVTADGSIINTGSNAVTDSKPFFRHYGPDLTGLFCGDSGSLGFKAAVTMRLIRPPQVKRFVSFSFNDYSSVFKATAAVGHSGLAAECFGFDPALQKQRMKRESLAKDVKVFSDVLKSNNSITGAIKDAVQLSTSGRRFMDKVEYSIHITIEQNSDDSADQTLKEIRQLCEKAGGDEIANSIPKIIGANPFVPLTNMVGPMGERWAPVHGLTPHSIAEGTMKAVEAFFARHKATMDKHDIKIGYLFATIQASVVIIEPVFFWPDELMSLHERNLDPAFLKRLNKFPADLEARAAVDKIHKGLVETFKQCKVAHFQLGKCYPYSDVIAPENLTLIKAIKQSLDPKGLVNPGALGLTTNSIND
jgi:FAD/FMN-containing dehydrogenase